MCIVFLREARLSPYAISSHTNSNAQMKRPTSAILSQKGRSKRSTDPPNWESMPQTVIGWADKTDWAEAVQRPKQRTRPVSAPVTRNRWAGQIMQFCKLGTWKLFVSFFAPSFICHLFVQPWTCSFVHSFLPFLVYPLVHLPLLLSIHQRSSMPWSKAFPKFIIYRLPLKIKIMQYAWQQYWTLLLLS